MSFSFDPAANSATYVATFTTTGGAVSVDIYRNDVQRYLSCHPNDTWIPTAQLVALVGMWLIEASQEQVEGKE